MLYCWCPETMGVPGCTMPPALHFLRGSLKSLGLVVGWFPRLFPSRLCHGDCFGGLRHSAVLRFGVASSAAVGIPLTMGSAQGTCMPAGGCLHERSVRDLKDVGQFLSVVVGPHPEWCNLRKGPSTYATTVWLRHVGASYVLPTGQRHKCWLAGVHWRHRVCPAGGCVIGSSLRVRDVPSVAIGNRDLP